MSVLWTTKNVRGTHVIAVTTDAAGVIDELDETNNSRTLNVKVTNNVVKPT